MVTFSNKTFYINTNNTSYIMRVLADGVLEHVYYGKRVEKQNIDFYNSYSFYAYTAMYDLNGEVTTRDEVRDECGCRGRGDYRIPTVVVKNHDGRGVNDFRYETHVIHKGAILVDGLPHLNVNTNSAETLEIILSDIITKTKLHMYYTVFEECDVIARHNVIENIGEEKYTVDSIMSMSLDFADCDFDMLSLYGRWANERTIERHPIFHGKTSISSNRGASGHQSNPFAALARRDTTEDYGDVYGVSLVYSGNFEIGAEVGQYNGTRFYAGLDSRYFSWELRAGEKFVSPQAILTFSSNGFTQMSKNFHSVCRNHLGACAIQKKHPVLLNIWEAFYFEVTEKKALDAIDSALNLGIDTVVLDDGWFGTRNSEDTAMGDWFVNKEKFPGGLEKIIKHCKDHGLKFGLWFEPEMIGPDSDLYRAHPDWCIHIDGVEPIQSRCEYILDLSRDEIVDYLYETISAILKEYDISYVKWDMNRNFTDNGTNFLQNNRQGEHEHRYMLGLYKLLDRFKKNFPDIFFEGSAGGGGRFDFGILYYMPQIWTSDNTDAIGRLNIQYGTSFVYPPETMSCHVSDCPNHQTGRTTPFDTRGDVAQLFSFGYELNPQVINESELQQIKAQIKTHRELENWLADSSFYRLIDPAQSDDCAWQAVSKDKKKSAAVYILQRTVPQKVGKFIRFKGLAEDKNYLVKPLNVTVSGDFLMNAGIPIKQMYKDFQTVFFEITQV